MNDQVQITEPSCNDILANMLETRANTLLDSFKPQDAVNGFTNSSEELWTVQKTYHSENNFMLNFERQADKDFGTTKLQFSIEFSNEKWHVWHGKTALTGNFLEIVQELARMKKETIWAQYALAALEVPLEEIEEEAA